MENIEILQNIKYNNIKGMHRAPGRTELENTEPREGPIPGKVRALGRTEPENTESREGPSPRTPSPGKDRVREHRAPGRTESENPEPREGSSPRTPSPGKDRAPEHRARDSRSRCMPIIY